MNKYLIALLVLLSQSCSTQTKKINGVSFVASRDSISNIHVQPVVRLQANYVAIMPFGFMVSLEHPEIVFNGTKQWFGETEQGVRQYIETFHEQNIKIMLKPQIWVRRGEFTGLIAMKNETDWKVLENSYSSFILKYAEIAEDMKVDILCIGTELEKFVEKRPDYWKSLILKIKKIYKGKLTYAANWNEYEKTPFWNFVDYIGIDAYFPVCDSKTPTIDECLLGWKAYKPTINALSVKYGSPILFTEYGYRSVDYSGKEPWKSDRDMIEVNLEAQSHTTQALFETFWEESWFAGGFVWKWHHNHQVSGGENNNRFTPQNKPVEDFIKMQYSKP